MSTLYLFLHVLCMQLTMQILMQRLLQPRLSVPRENHVKAPFKTNKFWLLWDSGFQKSFRSTILQTAQNAVFNCVMCERKQCCFKNLSPRVTSTQSSLMSCSDKHITSAIEDMKEGKTHKYKTSTSCSSSPASCLLSTCNKLLNYVLRCHFDDWLITQSYVARGPHNVCPLSACILNSRRANELIKYDN